MTALLLDTHVILWWLADRARLSGVAAASIDRADRLLISPLSCWEVAALDATGRVGLDRDVAAWVRDLFGMPRVELAPLSPEAAVVGARLDRAAFPGDPIDRLLYATARDHRVPFVTKDERLRSFAASTRDLEVIW